MNVYDATEQAYKNGYNKATKDMTGVTVTFKKPPVVAVQKVGVFNVQINEYEIDRIPNRFHRFMQKLIFGIEYEFVKEVRNNVTN